MPTYQPRKPLCVSAQADVYAEAAPALLPTTSANYRGTGGFVASQVSSTKLAALLHAAHRAIHRVLSARYLGRNEAADQNLEALKDNQRFANEATFSR